MKAASIREIKTALNMASQEELVALCLRMARYKVENKELLTYLLFEAGDEEGFIRQVKTDMEEQFDEINTTSIYFVKKGLRKVSRSIKRYIRFSGQKATTVELLLHFCELVQQNPQWITKSTTIKNMYFRQVEQAEKALASLHKDLQYDYQVQVDRLKNGL